MKNKQLFTKYKEGRHWEKHSISYVDRFYKFLQKKIPNFHYKHSIIDLGCGNGSDIFRLRNYWGVTAIGFDNDYETIRRAEEQTGFDCFYHRNIEQLLSEDNTSSAYFCINVMHYVDQKKVLREIYRTLRPLGYVFIHFNLLIFDENFAIDYHQKKSDVYELIKDFTIAQEKVFVRKDKEPYPHTHHILEVILQKPEKNK